MSLQRYIERPGFKLFAKLFVIVFCALGIAYITARPKQSKFTLINEQHPPHLNLKKEVLQDVGGGKVTELLSPDLKDLPLTDTNYESEEEVATDAPKEYNSPWTFACVNGLCQRTLFNENDSKQKEKISKNVCWLNCGRHGALWPIPTHPEDLAGKDLIPFQLSNLHFSMVDVNSDSQELQNALNMSFKLTTDILRSQIDDFNGRKDAEENDAQKSVQITVKMTSSIKDLSFLLETSEENYKLRISSAQETEDNGGTVKVDIEADTFLGIRHALETFSQLVAFDEINNQFQLVGNVEIEDKPSFRYRGVLIDVARNFISLPALRRVVDGMSYNKLNVLHLHLADIESFSVLHQTFPEMSICGSYSKKKTYKLEELGEFVKYARIRGIKVVPEFDPNHLRFLGDLGSLSEPNCFLRKGKDNSNGFLVNVFDPNTLTAIGEFYNSLWEVFDKDVIHFGSFDLSFDTKCLKSQKDNKQVDEWMKNENITDFAQIRPVFLNKVIEKIREMNDGKSIPAMIFGSDFTDSNLKAFNSSSYIMQTWEDAGSSRGKFLTKENYRIVISDSKYSQLNSGFNGPNHQYNLWQSLYDGNFPTDAFLTQILGSEVLIWTQNTNEGSLEAKLWPRASALAERLWSNPKSREKDVYARLNHHNSRMMSRGLRIESLQPESCYLISGNCDDPRHKI